MTKKAHKLLKRALVTAVNESWIGSTPPEEHKKIIHAARLARTELVSYIHELEKLLPARTTVQ